MSVWRSRCRAAASLTPVRWSLKLRPMPRENNRLKAAGDIPATLAASASVHGSA
jgi:hypothetical protein